MAPQLMQHLLARIENGSMDLPGKSNKAELHIVPYMHIPALPSPIYDFTHINSQLSDDSNPEKHVVTALLRQVKGEHNEQPHLVPSVTETKAGIQVRRWLGRTLAAKSLEG